jgi:hypothetical protein
MYKICDREQALKDEAEMREQDRKANEGWE